MKNYILLLALTLLANSFLFSQHWETAGRLDNNARYDDVYFHDPNLGWTVNGSGQVYKTIDGGITWELLYSELSYFRAVEFLDENIGFVGTLNGKFLKTIDGGNTWEEIQNLIPGLNKDICGLSHIEDHLFGVGVYSYPAYFIKSTDKGETWTYMDLSNLADGLVECHFLDKNLGFIAGIDEDEGAIILKTTDGGESWTTVFNSQNGAEYVWKLDFVTDDVAFGSIENLSGDPATIVKTTDGGENWSTHQVDSVYLDLQGIGFINQDVGWVGPRHERMYETTNGGLTWTQTELYRNVNRFFKVRPNLMFAAGSQIYKYSDASVSTTEVLEYDEKHKISISPNPFSESVMLSVKIGVSTNVRIDLFNQSGQLVNNIYNGKIEKGEHEYGLGHQIVSQIADGIYFVVLRTNEGFYIEKIVKNEY